MRLLDENHQHKSSRGKYVVAIVMGLVLLATAGYWYLSRPEAPPTEAAKPEPPAPKPEAPKPTPPPKPAGPSTGTLSVTANVEGATVYLDGKAVGEAPYRQGVEPGAYEIRVAKDGYETFDKIVAVSRGREANVNVKLVLEPARLRVESDIPGATVFLDRKYVGTTPVTITDVGPGGHALTVSAEGYDIHSETLELKTGSRDLYVRFKEVRLHETAKVVHKHTFGSCEGTLIATPDGLTYETTNKKDGFSVPFSSLETFEVDFIEKNLQVKVRGGRKYNFTEKSGDADVLFVFHKNVESAMKRLADE